MNELNSGNVLICADGEMAVASVKSIKPAQHVASLATAENDGRLFLMPLAIGTSAWFFDAEEGPDIYECTVRAYRYLPGTEMWHVSLQPIIQGVPTGHFEVPVDELGACWFKTREDASIEAALQSQNAVNRAFQSGVRAGAERMYGALHEEIFSAPDPFGGDPAAAEWVVDAMIAARRKAVAEE